MKNRIRERGSSFAQLLVVVAIVGIMSLVAVPMFKTIFSRAQADGAALEIAAAAREARWKAVSQGWQFRVQGYGKQATATLRNQYRLLARSTTAVAWPADTSSPFTSTTQYAGPWFNLKQQFNGVDVNPSSSANGGRFLVSFDSRGVAFENEVFAPLTLTSSSGKTRTLTISTSGNVQIQ